MKSNKVKKSFPPADCPNNRAKQLNKIALHEHPDISMLSENELNYVLSMQKLIERFNIKTIDAYQARAEQCLLQVAYLQNGKVL